MCGIAGIVRLDCGVVVQLERALAVQSNLIAHRGPDGDGSGCRRTRRRLDPSAARHHRSQCGGRAAHDGPNGTVITYNGEIYNYRELRAELSGRWQFRTQSDTECILASYEHWRRVPIASARHVCFRAVG